MEKNKVLVAAPIGGHKQYSINTWFQWIANQDYKNYDIVLCTNGKDQHKLIPMIQKVEIKDKHGIQRRIRVLMLPDSNDMTFIQKVTFSREKIRRYAVAEGYDYLFFLDTDTIPYHKDAIQHLMNHDKKVISGLYFYKNSKTTVVIDQDTDTNITIEKCEAAAKTDQIIEVWGFGFGVLLLHKDVFSSCEFDYELFEEFRTDDFSYCHVLEQAGIRKWCCPYTLCIHLAKNPESSLLFRGLKAKD